MWLFLFWIGTSPSEIPWLELRTQLETQHPELGPLTIRRRHRSAFRSLLSSDQAEYGQICTIVGIPPAERIAIERILGAKEIQALRFLLKAGPPAARLYAAEALLRLQDHGRPLSDEEVQWVRDLIVYPQPVRTCNGCMVTETTTQTVLTDPKGPFAPFAAILNLQK
ncbi:MAG: hypothetical protein H6510_11375 [Acidobacteria bacterium]|nr:hypothetical protein [Acidobacteriota bacterium]